ncbi:MAG: PaaX domain-containing protein, C- domain protein, partial [Nocardioides sp.]|nr:PaaX domain-containing protein, C- domain protein [Nocardioides sp.]
MTAVHRNVAESGGALSARSVVLSLLLGHHPASLPSAYLTRAGEHFGISASTVRVALARAVAAGDLHREGKEYVLGERLLRRQRRQDEAIEPVQARWDGQWEMAVVVVSGRTSGDRASLRETLSEDRLAELREGVWMRPANLQRVPAHQSHPVLSTFRATPDEDPAALA